jgi:hypothetical protein
VNDQQDNWLTLSPGEVYDPKTLSTLAETISEKLPCKCIQIDYGDASGILQYSLYQNGKLSERYCYGPDYSEEMQEYGKLREAQENETLIRDGENEYIYFKKGPHPEESIICGGDEFLDSLLIEQKVIVSWDYCD